MPKRTALLGTTEPWAYERSSSGWRRRSRSRAEDPARFADRSLAGRAGDIVAGRVDVRVLVVIRYLAVTFHEVTVSCLVTGHRFFARRNVMSAHVDGLAVDISSVRWIPIAGNQGIGGITERTIEALLRLPAELQPQQIISLLGLGGPSFPQGDHYDHIHVGF